MINFLKELLGRKEKGQTLIEAVITLGIALVIITAVVTLANASNRRATLARQATQASKLAQEGMEIVRHIRDSGQSTIQVGPGCSVASPCTWSDLYSQNQLDPTTGHLFFNTGTNQWELRGIAEPLLLTLFTRTVEIYDNKIGTDVQICANPEDLVLATPDLELQDIKRVSVTVTWTSPIGAQEREVVSCLSDK